MSYKRLIPCIFIYNGKAVKWFHDKEIVSENVVELAQYYSNQGADELLVFDLSDNDDEHTESIELIQKINRVIPIPMIAGGNIKRLEDVKRILYTGVKRVMLNFSKPDMFALTQEAANRFGKEKIAVSLNDFDALFKQQQIIEQYSSELIFMHRLDLNSVMNLTSIPCIIVTDTVREEELFHILRCPGVKGLSGRFVSDVERNFSEFKDKCAERDIKITSFESLMDFSEFHTDAAGIISVITQDYKTGEILSVRKMDREAFETTVKTGKMTYYCADTHTMESKQYQYVKSMTVNETRDTLLAKIDFREKTETHFTQSLIGSDESEKNPLQIFEYVYQTILNRKQNPKEDSYTTYLFEKGIDKILKKIGEEATEIVIAAKNPSQDELKSEFVDFLYHAMVLMVERDVTWEELTEEMAKR